MDGVVKRYIPGKNFGFILGEDGKDYFFRDPHGTGEDITGAKVVFEPCVDQRGYCARKLSILRGSRVLRFPDEVLLMYRGRNLTGDKVLVTDTDLWAQSDAFRSRSEARRHLQLLAKQAGANAVLDVTCRVSERTNGNHIHSVHAYRGRLAVVGELAGSGSTIDAPQIRSIRDQIHAFVINAVESARRYALRKKRNANRRLLLGTGLFAAGFVVQFVTEQMGLHTEPLLYTLMGLQAEPMGYALIGLFALGFIVAVSGLLGRPSSQVCPYSIGGPRG